jgi:hypothetical protein
LRRFRHFTKAAMLVLMTSIGALVLPAGAQAAGPTNTSPPSVSGTPQVGQTLSETGGSWANITLPATDSVKWERCPNSSTTNCPAIPNSPTTSPSSYTLVPADVGSFIVVAETVTDSNGQTTAYSAPVGIVTTTSTTALTASPQPSVTNQPVTLVGTVTRDRARSAHRGRCPSSMAEPRSAAVTVFP